MVSQQSPASEWPGQRLGYPQSGVHSIGRPGRRFAAIAIDWATASVIGYAFFGGDGFAILGVFAVAQIVFLVLTAGSVGHLLLGMRVVRLEGGYLGVWRPIVRTLLLCLAIPALIWDRDQRGFHDKAVGTVLIRVR
jgi:uncharacterized RDD family membrane protein YckC